MTCKFWNSLDVIGKYMEVIIRDENDNEFVYWVNLQKKHEDKNEYDWSIKEALSFHNKKNKTSLKENDTTVGDPFSRNESEFTFVN